MTEQTLCKYTDSACVYPTWNRGCENCVIYLEWLAKQQAKNAKKGESLWDYLNLEKKHIDTLDRRLGR